jgi:hypothetical protein
LSLVALIAATVLAAPQPFSNYEDTPAAFDKWALEHGMSYATAELRAHHFANWQSNVAKVNAHNDAYFRGEKTFFLAVNRLAHLSHSEYKRNMLRPMPSRKTAAIRTHRSEDAPAAPAQWNWIDKNVVTGIKDQVGHTPYIHRHSPCPCRCPHASCAGSVWILLGFQWRRGDGGCIQLTQYELHAGRVR